MQTRIAKVPKRRAEQVISNADSHPRLNLIARWDVGAEKTVHFNAHYDVVPVAGRVAGSVIHSVVRLRGNGFTGAVLTI